MKKIIVMYNVLLLLSLSLLLVVVVVVLVFKSYMEYMIDRKDRQIKTQKYHKYTP